MFSFSDPNSRRDQVSRREMLRVGGLSTMGLTLPRLLQAAESNSASSINTAPAGIGDDPTFGKAKNIIYVWLQGGPSQYETFDPKPEAPLEVRGPFQPIQTNVVGTHFSELLPRTSAIADKLAIVRSMATDSNIHSSSGYHVLTGYPYRGPNARTITPNDWPYFGSILKMIKPSEELPILSTVWLPDIMRLNESVTPAGQTAGFLGPLWEPNRIVGDPNANDYKVEGLAQPLVKPDRFMQRRSLLQQLETQVSAINRSSASVTYDHFRTQAYDLLTSGKVKQAFEVDREPAALRDRYGRNSWAQSCLLARRLIEVGVRIVHVNWTREPGDSAVTNPMWDTHAQNADRMEDVLCPIFDVGFTALMEDLEQRGLLDETLVVAIGEFGRTPKINSSGGRDHWGSVFSFALAGARIAAGTVYGASDNMGAHPARDRVTPGDLNATILHLLGVDHTIRFTDRQAREHQVTTGLPIAGVLASGPTKRVELMASTGNPNRLPPYDPSLLLNTQFDADTVLYNVTTGSRPKGWRAHPLADTPSTNVFRLHKPSGAAATAQGLQFVFELAANQSYTLTGDSFALLAQEFRNPRAGTYHLTARLSASSTSADFYQNDFLNHYNCRLTLYRYKNDQKIPLQRDDKYSWDVVPALTEATSSAVEPSSIFQFKGLFDTAGPGLNFDIGNGMGIALLVEPKSAAAEWNIEAAPLARQVTINIHELAVEFESRTINDKVKV